MSHLFYTISRTTRYAITLLYSKVLSWYWTDTFIPEDKKIVFIDNPTYDFHRYIYLLCLILSRAGYRVVIRPYPKRIARLKIDKHGKKIFHLPHVSFSSTKLTKGSHTCLSDIRPHYFEHTEAYKVPIFQHPVMYEKNINDLITPARKANGFFFAGDFRNELYTQLDKYDDGHWNRIKLRHKIQDITTFNKQIAQAIEILDNETMHLSAIEYRKKLGTYRYLLAFPGIHMPLCHNIAEAMSLGVIPFIHRSYADMFYPPLTHLENAFIYEDFDKIEEHLSAALSISDEKATAISISAKKLYEEEMSESAIVNNVLKNHTEIRLLASWNSRI